MKKLMIVAAATALVGVASAFDCQLVTPNTPSVQTAAVHAWKFKGKTTEGVKVGKTIAGSSGSDCVIGTPSTTDTCYIRVPASLAIQGYTYICDNCCDAFKAGTAGYTAAEFYATKPHKSGLTSTITFDVAHIIGKTAKQYEAEGDATFVTTAQGISEQYALRFAGLGSYDLKKGTPTSISGNFAGKVTSPYYVDSRTHVCAPADYWTCAPIFAGDPTAASVAYGTWSVKYNSSASKKFLNGVKVALPAWAR